MEGVYNSRRSSNITQMIETEYALLGGILLDPTGTRKTIGVIDTMVFQDDKHREIAASINTLEEEDVPVDIVTVCTKLQARGTLEYIGGPEAIAAMMNYCPTSAHTEKYYKICQNNTALIILKKLLIALKENKENYTLNEIIGKLKEGILKIEKRFNKIEKPKSTLELLALAEEEQKTNPAPKTLFIPLNRLLNEKTPKSGHLWIVGAYQKVGKTALSIQLAHNFIAQGHKTRFISLEMANIELAERLDRYNRIAQVPISKDLYDNFIISELKAPQIEQVIYEIESCEEEFVFVDYLQIISSKGSERENMEKFPMLLKNAARQSGKIVVALSQTSNEAATAPTRKKTPFKGSANIGAAADLGIALYRDLDAEVHEKNNVVDATLDVIINRHGRSGVCNVCFDRDSGFFVPNSRPGFTETNTTNINF